MKPTSILTIFAAAVAVLVPGASYIFGINDRVVELEKASAVHGDAVIVIGKRVLELEGRGAVAEFESVTRTIIPPKVDPSR
jgi:hypothetical protein